MKYEDYQKRKQEVMTQEQIKRAHRYLDFFGSAYNDKEQRGLFEKWETIDLYWEGDVNLPESDIDPGSNTNIIYPNVEGQVALLVDQNIAIQTHPVGPSDMPFSETARIILEWIKEKNKMKRKLDVHERRRQKFGTGIFRVLFDPDALNGFGLPVIEPCNPAYVFVDPAITDIYKVQDARFIIEVMNKSINWAKKRYGEKAEAIMPGYYPMDHEWIFGEDDGESDEISRDTYLHMLVWVMEDEGLRLVEMSGCGVILRDTFNEEEKVYFPKNKYPYFFTPWSYREGTVWAKGNAELLLNTQDLINDFDDQIRINARLTGNIQKVVGEGSGIDVDKWTNEPGLNIPATDVNEWKMVQPPNLPQYIFRRREYALEYERPIVTRFSDQMFGQRQKGVDTATEALVLQQAGIAGIDHEKILLQETLSEVFEYCLDLVKEYYTEEMAFRITEKENKFVWFRGSQLKEIPVLVPATLEFREKYKKQYPEKEPPEWMQLGNETKEAMFDIEVTVGAGIPKNKAFIYNAIREAYAAGAISREEYRKILREYINIPIEEEQITSEMPLQQQQQTELTSPDVMGLSQNQNPAALGLLGGGENA